MVDETLDNGWRGWRIDRGPRSPAKSDTRSDDVLASRVPEERPGDLYILWELLLSRECGCVSEPGGAADHRARAPSVYETGIADVAVGLVDGRAADFCVSVS